LEEVEIISRKDWGAVQARSRGERLEEYPARGVVLSQTTTRSCWDSESCSRVIRTVQNSTMTVLGFADIPYNFLVGGDGSVYEGRGWGVTGAHTKGLNSKTVGISFIGNFEVGSPPGPQLAAVGRLVRLGVRLNEIRPDYILFPHRQLLNTASAQFLNTLRTWDHWKDKFM
jgi:N-acetylmuramoyl-L-alanine amidase